jgi:hypothetical protein
MVKLTRNALQYAKVQATSYRHDHQAKRMLTAAAVGGKKTRRSSWSQTRTTVSGAVLVDTPTLERWQLLQTETVVIACATGVHALLLGGVSGCQDIEAELGIARIDPSDTQGQQDRYQYADGSDRMAQFHWLNSRLSRKRRLIAGCH